MESRGENYDSANEIENEGGGGVAGPKLPADLKYESQSVISRATRLNTNKYRNKYRDLPQFNSLHRLF